MKKFLIATLLTFTLFSTANACDICGGGVGNYNPFLFPHLSKNYIGLNFLSRSFQTHNDDGSITHTRYTSFLISGQYSISQKLQLIAFVPYEYNQLKKDNGISKSNGAGDISLLLNYKLWERMGTDISQALMVGGGVKFATGSYKQPENTDLNDRNFQLGTGSTDYVINGTYRLGYRQWVVNAVGSYKYNTANKEDYRFGNVLTVGGIVAYRKNFHGISVAPYAQVLSEHQAKNADHSILQEESGSSVLYTGGGLDLTVSRLTIGANYQVAAKSLPAGELDANSRISARISFTF